MRCYHRRNERFTDNSVIEHNFIFGGSNVMVWGAINAGFLSDLLILNGTLTAPRYIDGILNPVLLPLLDVDVRLRT